MFDNQEREYKPIYNDARDYTTNAPSYYDYLADANKAIQSAYEDIANLVEGDIVEDLTSKDENLLKITKKTVKDKFVTYELEPIGVANIKTTNSGIAIQKDDNDVVNLTFNGQFIDDIFQVGQGLNIGTVGNKKSLYVNTAVIQTKLNFSDGVKQSGSNVTADWSKIQKTLKPDNSSIIIDKDGNVSAQVPYDRLQSRIKKWRNVGSAFGNIYSLGQDVQPVTENIGLIRKTGIYWVQAVKTDDPEFQPSDHTAYANTPSGQMGLLEVFSVDDDDKHVIQRFTSWRGEAVFVRGGGYNIAKSGYETTTNFWSDWRIQYSQKLYSSKTKQWGDQKGKMWGQESSEADTGLWIPQAGYSGDTLKSELLTNNSNTKLKMRWLEASKDVDIQARIRYAKANKPQWAGDCNNFDNVYYKIEKVDTLNQKITLVAHSAVNGIALQQWEISNPAFTSYVNDISCANDKIYFAFDKKIWWLDTKDYSSGVIELPVLNGTNKRSNGDSSSVDPHLYVAGIDFMNNSEKHLQVIVAEDYGEIVADKHLGTITPMITAWNLTLNEAGTGTVSSKSAFTVTTPTAVIKGLAIVDGLYHVGVTLDTIHNPEALSAYGNLGLNNPCGVGVWVYDSTGNIQARYQMLAQGVSCRGIGTVDTPVRDILSTVAGVRADVDGVIEGFSRQLMVGVYGKGSFNGVFTMQPYRTITYPTVDMNGASRMVYNSEGTTVIKNQLDTYSEE